MDEEQIGPFHPLVSFCASCDQSPKVDVDECRIALDESSKVAKRVSINLTNRRKQGNAGSEKKQCANAELKWRNRWLDAFLQLSSFLRQHNARVNRADEKCKLVKTESDTMGGHDHPTTCPPQRLRTLRFNALLSLQPMFSVL